MTTSADPSEYLSREWQWLDLLLHREILRLRARYQLSLDEFRGLYISDEQVNQLIDHAHGHPEISAVDDLTAHATSLRAALSEHIDENIPWCRLIRNFALTPIEQNILLLAVAPEINLKYETLYAYLNNDITRKCPTRDLAMRLLAVHAEQLQQTRAALLPEAPLFSNGLLQTIQSPAERPAFASIGFAATPVIVHYLYGLSALDPRLTAFTKQLTPATNWDEVPVAPEQRARLQRRAAAHTETPWPLLIFTGRTGAGRAIAAEAMCANIGIPLLRVDLERLRATGEDLPRAAQALRLQQRLQHAGLYLAHGEALCDKEGRPAPDAQSFLQSFQINKAPVFLACESEFVSRELTTGIRAIGIPFADPDHTLRLQLWEQALTGAGVNLLSADLTALADRFMFTPGQIKTVNDAAVDALAFSPDSAATERNVAAALFAAARAHSDQSLGHLAGKVKTTHTWDDLILPLGAMRRVREIAAAIQSRHIVYTEWGFAARVMAGQGLKVLFGGASGTGKTMTAGVIARELGLELYKIDLSSVVSKYIGETEKNLDRIFRAATCSNAILFFDEADALFGKRSEVKDAHDRYANIEVSYLLQKVEEYDGVVILASNLSKNIDDAFSRRMHYIVDFPLPDETQRERLWRGMFPPRAALGDDINFPFLAKQFSLAGGDIRNVALDAAFLAAQNGRVITMKQIIHALARQMNKQGRVVSPVDFKQYHALLHEPAPLVLA